MSGNQISDMTLNVTLPTGSYVPFIVTSNLSGLSPLLNYRYDLGADLIAVKLSIAAAVTSIAQKVPYTELAASDGASLVGFGGTTVEAVLETFVYASAYGVSTANANNSAALASAVTAAIAAHATLILPPGTLPFASTITLPNSAYGLKIMGSGRPISFNGNLNGDPTSPQGTVLNYTGGSGNGIQLTLSPPDKRVYLTLENLTIRSSGGTSGKGIVLTAADPAIGILACYRDVSFVGFDGGNIAHVGNVFECQLFNVRLSESASGSGFSATASGGGLPGETRFYGCVFDYNDTGAFLSGGGTFSFFGCTTSYNTANAVVANGVTVRWFGGICEGNGSTVDSQIDCINCIAPLFYGLEFSVVTNSTGAGIKFTGCLLQCIYGCVSNSTATPAQGGTVGVGYYDIDFNNSVGGEIRAYRTADGTKRANIGTLGGNLHVDGGIPYSGQLHAVAPVMTVTSTASQVFNLNLYDSFRITCNAGGGTLNIGAPTVPTTFNDGQRTSVSIYNNTGGAMTINWNAAFLMPTFTAPANGKRATVLFEYNSALSKLVQQGAQSPDI